VIDAMDAGEFAELCEDARAVLKAYRR